MKLKSLLLCAALPFALLACGGSGDDEPVPLVKGFGKAHLSAPLVGASVEVFDAGGQHVGTLEHTTDAGGIFDVELPAGKASRFRLVVTGGTHDGQPFTDRLLLDAEGFDASREPLYANAATTLISRYIDRHPGMGVAQAADRVKAFLKIPAHSSPGFSVDNPHQNYFRHERLLASMQASGAAGLVPFLDGLVAEMNAGVASHTFARAPMLRGGIGDIFSKLAAFLGHALADEGLGLAFETVMTKLGLDGTAEILHELHEINHKLDELQVLTTEVLVETKDMELQALTLALAKDVTIIQNLYKNLTTVAQTSLTDCGGGDAACEELRQARLKDRQDVVLGYMKEILEGVHGSTPVAMKLDIIAGQLGVVTITEPGLFGRASEFLKMSRYFDSAVADPRLVATKEYYQTVQAMGMHLVVEALMARQPTEGKSAAEQQVFRERMKKESQDAIDLFNARVAQQDARVNELRFKNEEVVEQLRTNLVWMRAPISNLKRPHLDGEWHDIWPVEAKRLCAILKDEHFAGYSGWRLPTESEFHKFVKGSPNDSGNADGGRGIFDWLVAQGFQRGPGNGQLFQRGIVVDEKMKTAYFTSTYVTGGYYEALWDHGVDSAADIPQYRMGHYIPSIAGAWCVTQKTAGH